MTQSSRNPTWVSALLLGALLLAVGGVWCYIAGAIFMHLIHRPVDQAQLLTYYQYWHYYGDMPEVHKRLIQAGGLGVAALLVPVALLLAPRQKKLHGDARFARFSEVRQAGLLAQTGIIVGQWGRKILIYAGAQHVLMSAPTRSGKGAGIAIPNMLNWPESVVALDVKQELFDLTSGFRKKYGQECFLFNPAPRDYRTHRWNPLSYVSANPDFRINDIQKIAGFLWPDMDGQDPIWSASCRSLFLGTVLYILETPTLKPTIGEVLRQVTQSEEAGQYFSRVLQEREESGNPLPPECVSALNDFITTSTNTRTSIRKTFTSRLELWFNPVIDAATAANDFDFRDLRKRKISIYVGVTPDDLERMEPLLNLFFQQLIDVNTQELPMQNPALKYQCLLLLDEFAAIGRMKALAKGIGYLAGYGLRMLPILQDMAQTEDIYGEKKAQTFSTNHALHIAFAPRDQGVAEKISKALGTQTWRVKSWGRSSGGKGGTRSTNQSDHARPLLLPQEVKEVGESKQFIFLENCKPILCTKIRYFLDERFMGRLREVSPTLAKMGKRLPTKAELEAIADQGELRVPIEPLVLVRRGAVSAAKPAAETPSQGSSTVVTVRDMTVGDIERLDSMNASDFSCDFSDVSLPSRPTEEQLTAGVADLLSRFGVA